MIYRYIPHFYYIFLSSCSFSHKRTKVMYIDSDLTSASFWPHFHQLLTSPPPASDLTTNCFWPHHYLLLTSLLPASDLISTSFWPHLRQVLTSPPLASDLATTCFWSNFHQLLTSSHQLPASPPFASYLTTTRTCVWGFSPSRYLKYAFVWGLPYPFPITIFKYSFGQETIISMFIQYICLIYSMCFVDQYLFKCEIYKLQTLTVALFIR